jgi:hypothetical protein
MSQPVPIIQTGFPLPSNLAWILTMAMAEVSISSPLARFQHTDRKLLTAVLASFLEVTEVYQCTLVFSNDRFGATLASIVWNNG